LFTEHDQPRREPAPDSREEGSDDTADDDEAARASPPDELNEPDARANGVPNAAVDGTVVTPDVPMAHLWHMARQRLRADLTPAQYSSWLVNTELYRVPDGSLVLVTGTTFAAELIARRWGERIQWVLSEITGRVVTLTVRVQRLGSAVPDG
jgi:DnaA N-terminal domain